MERLESFQNAASGKVTGGQLPTVTQDHSQTRGDSRERGKVSHQSLEVKNRGDGGTIPEVSGLGSYWGAWLLTRGV